ASTWQGPPSPACLEPARRRLRTRASALPKPPGNRPEFSVLPPSFGGRKNAASLDLDGRACGLELSFDLLGLLLRHTLLDGLVASLDEVLCLLQAKIGDRTDLLDDVDLLVTGRLQDDGELRLLIGRRCRRRSSTGGRGNSNSRCSGRSAPLLLEHFGEL